jgi:hypothetical protein
VIIHVRAFAGYQSQRLQRCVARMPLSTSAFIPTALVKAKKPLATGSLAKATHPLLRGQQARRAQAPRRGLRDVSQHAVATLRAVQVHSKDSRSDRGLSLAADLCREVETYEVKSVYTQEPVRIRVYRDFNAELLEPLGITSWDAVTEEAAEDYPVTYENYEVVYYESGCMKLQCVGRDEPLILQAGDLAEFSDGVHGDGRVTENLRRRFVFCSPDEWEASLRRAITETLEGRPAQAADADVLPGRSKYGTKPGATSSETTRPTIEPLAHQAGGEFANKITNSSSKKATRRNRGAKSSLKNADREPGNAARAKMDAELAFPNWVAYALADIIQLGAATTLILFWDSGPGAFIPSKEINFLLHYIFVPIGTAGAFLSAVARFALEVAPSLKEHPLVRLVPRYEDIDDPRQKYLQKRD